jgi:acyl-CoA thioesterase I
MIRAALCATAIAAALHLSGGAFAAEPDLCAAPSGATTIVPPLERLAARIEDGGPLTIVAVGSSSTAGTGASNADFAYPRQLEADLRQSFPKLDIRVINQGRGGEDAPEELARLPRDVVALHPDLVIWQVGTNAVLRRDDLVADGEWMREGVNLLIRNGIDVVLMDLQYAPRVLERPSYPTMEALVAETADHAGVGLFRRFALMRYWQRTHAPDAPAMIGADGLHMTDAGYGCLAADLAAALAANWHAEAKLAHHQNALTNAVAGLPQHSPAIGAGAEPAGAPRRNDAMPFD